MALAMLDSHATDVFLNHHPLIVGNLYDLIPIGAPQPQCFRISTSYHLAAEMAVFDLPLAREPNALTGLSVQKKAGRCAIRRVSLFHVVERQRPIIEYPGADDACRHF